LCVTQSSRHEPVWSYVDQHVLADSMCTRPEECLRQPQYPTSSLERLVTDCKTQKINTPTRHFSTIMYVINDNASQSRRGKHDYVSGGCYGVRSGRGGQRRMIGKGSKNGARMNGMGCPVDEMCKYADPASKPQMTTKMSLRGLFFFHSGLVF
jgi:hypothetical protein